MRPSHIHFKITPQSDEYKPLITQVYFEQDGYRKRDPCRRCNATDPSLIIKLKEVKKGEIVTGHWNVYLRKQNMTTI